MSNLFTLPGLTLNTAMPNYGASISNKPAVNISNAYASGGMTSAPQVNGVSTVNTQTQNNQNKQTPAPQNKNNNPTPNTSNPVVTGTTAPTPQGPSEGEINALYDPSMNYLNQAESALKSDYGNVLTQAEKDFQTLATELAGNKQTNLNTIAESGIQATQTKDDALTAARRLYDELRKGYQQRFGGASSAGQAASEISAVEQQRQMGQTTRQYADTVRQIESQKQKVETDYQTGLMKLEQNKMSAINQAQSQFQSKLLEIASNKAQIGQAKAQARLDALQQLRNQVFQIQQQTYQFQQALDAQKQQSSLDLNAYMQKLNAYGSDATQAVANSGMSTDPSSGLQVSGTPLNWNANDQMAGMIAYPQSTKKNDYLNQIP